MADENDLLNQMFSGSQSALNKQQSNSREQAGFDMSVFGNKPGPIPGQQPFDNVSAAKQKQYKPASVADVAKGLGSGVEVGAAEMAGFPGDVAAAARWLGEESKYYGTKAAEHYGYVPEGTADQNWKAVEEARKSPDRNWVGPLPTSQVTTDFAKKYIPGADYEPESRAGAFAHTVGEFAPTVLGGEGSLVKRLGTAAIAGIGSEALGQATEGTEFEPYARLAGAVASPFVAEKTLARPLGSVGSALGASDQFLSSVGLTSPNAVTRQKLIDPAQQLKNIGAFRGLPEDTIQTILADEAANGIPPSQSKIRLMNALSDSPTDVIRSFINSTSLENPKVRDEVTRLFADHNKLAETADVTASKMLGDIHDEAALNALNAQRVEHGIDEFVTEAPTADKLREVADEVRRGAWEREVQPIYDKHAAVQSGTLDAMLPIANSQIVENTMNDINRIRQIRGQQPYNFLTRDENGNWTAQGFGAASYKTPFYQKAAKLAGEADGVTKGAPLEFWDMLAGNLQGSNNKADQLIGQQIREGIDQYFTNKKLPNELKAAKDSFRNIRGEGNAVTAGMKFISDGSYQANPARRQMFLNRWDKMSDVEKGLYQAGVMQQIYSTISQGQKGFSDWRRIMQNQDNRNLLQTVMDFRPATAQASDGLSNFEKLQNALNVADAYKKEDVSRILANTNASRSFFSKLMAPIGTDGRSIAGILLNSAERAYLFGTPFGAITILNGGMGYIRQVLADREARRMLNILASRDPAQTLALARDISSSPQKKTAWQKIQALLDFTNKSTINFYRRAAIAANQQPQGRKEGGRVGYGPGGSASADDDTSPTDLDENNMYSPTGRAMRSLPATLGNQKMPIAQLLTTALGKGANKYELGHAGVLDPFQGSMVPGRNLQGITHMTPYELGQLVEKNSPIPQILNHDFVDVGEALDRRREMYHDALKNLPSGQNLTFQDWQLQNQNRSNYPRPTEYDRFRGHTLQQGHPNSYFEVPISINPSSKAGEPFIPPREDISVVRDPNKISAKAIDATGREIMSFPMHINNASENILKDVAHINLSDEIKSNAKYSDQYKAGHFKEIPNMVVHVRGQTLGRDAKSPDDPAMPVLNIDEVQSDANREVRGKKINPMTLSYDPQKHRQLYQDAVSANQQSKTAEEEYQNLQNLAQQQHANVADVAKEYYRSINPFKPAIKLQTEKKKLAEIEGKLTEAHSNHLTKMMEAGRKRSQLIDMLSMSRMAMPHLALADDESRYTRFVNKAMLQRAIEGNHGGITWTPWQEQIMRNRHGIPVHRLDWRQSEGDIHLNPTDSKRRPVEMDPSTRIVHPRDLHLVLGNRVADIIKNQLANKSPSGTLQNIPMFVSPMDELKARAAEKTIQYYSKTAPGDMESYLRSMDPDVKLDPNFRTLESDHSDEAFPQPGIRITDKIRKALKKGQPRYKEGGEVERPQRATGGRIPEIDKLFKSAKKTLDGETKPMLHMHDDDIVNALRIAQGRV